MSTSKGDDMAHRNVSTPTPEPDQAASRSQSVRDDIFAIFGGDQRVDTSKLLSRAHPLTAKRRGKLSLLALSLCGVGAMLTVGILAGTDVIKPAELKKDGAPARAAQVTAPTPAESTVLATPSRPVQVDASRYASAPTGDRVLALERGQTHLNGEPTRHPEQGPPAAPEKPGSDLVSDHVRRVDQKDDDRLVIASETSGQVACSTAEECLRSRVRYGDQRVAASFEMAAAAGVRSSILRDYRDEWVRARGLAIKRPQEAVRVYGMIDSDLRLLAADPTVE